MFTNHHAMAPRTRLVALATAAVFGSAVTAVPATGLSAASAAPAAPAAAPAAAPQPADAVLPVSGTLPDGTEFTGELSDLSTRVVDGAIQLSGTITGTGLPAGGTEFTTPVQDLSTAAAASPAAAAGPAAAQAACDVLTLDLGPLHLDLLGLVIDLAPVNLDVTAVPGAGNLLGNLVCAIAGLLDNPAGGPLGGLSALLNRLLTGLGLGG